MERMPVGFSFTATSTERGLCKYTASFAVAHVSRPELCSRKSESYHIENCHEKQQKKSLESSGARLIAQACEKDGG
jgi:hypothetical protein